MRLGQTVPMVSVSNTLAITVAGNSFMMPVLSEIRIKGFSGLDLSSSEQGSLLSLASLGGAAHHGLFCVGNDRRMALWNRSSEEIVLSLCPASTLVAGEVYQLAVEVVNPPQPLAAPLLSISAVDRHGDVLLNWYPLAKPSSLGAADTFTGEGYADPFRLVLAGFSVRSIGQSTGLASFSNTISVTLGPGSLDVLEGSRQLSLFRSSTGPPVLVVSGLLGASMSAEVNLMAPSPIAPSNLDASATFCSASGVPKRAEWNQETKELRLRVCSGSALLRGKVYVLAFEILNPSSPQESPEISIALEGGTRWVPAAMEKPETSSMRALSVCKWPSCAFEPGFYAVDCTTCAACTDKYPLAPNAQYAVGAGVCPSECSAGFVPAEIALASDCVRSGTIHLNLNFAATVQEFNANLLGPVVTAIASSARVAERQVSVTDVRDASAPVRRRLAAAMVQVTAEVDAPAERLSAISTNLTAASLNAELRAMGLPMVESVTAGLFPGKVEMGGVWYNSSFCQRAADECAFLTSSVVLDQQDPLCGGGCQLGWEARESSRNVFVVDSVDFGCQVAGLCLFAAFLRKYRQQGPKPASGKAARLVASERDKAPSLAGAEEASNRQSSARKLGWGIFVLVVFGVTLVMDLGLQSVAVYEALRVIPAADLLIDRACIVNFGALQEAGMEMRGTIAALRARLYIIIGVAGAKILCSAGTLLALHRDPIAAMLKTRPVNGQVAMVLTNLGLTAIAFAMALLSYQGGNQVFGTQSTHSDVWCYVADRRDEPFDSVLHPFGIEPGVLRLLIFLAATILGPAILAFVPYYILRARVRKHSRVADTPAAAQPPAGPPLRKGEDNPKRETPERLNGDLVAAREVGWGGAEAKDAEPAPNRVEVTKVCIEPNFENVMLFLSIANALRTPCNMRARLTTTGVSRGQGNR